MGSRVRVELHGRRVGAWVVEDHVRALPGIPLLPLAASSGDGPPPGLVALAQWAAWRWAGPVSSFLGTASPGRTVRGAWSGAPNAAPTARGTGRPRARLSRRGFRGAGERGPGRGGHAPSGRRLGGPAGPFARRHLGGSGVPPPDGSRRRAGAGAVGGPRRPAGRPAATVGPRRGPHARGVGVGLRPVPPSWSGPGRQRGRRSPRSGPPWSSTPTTRPTGRSARRPGRPWTSWWNGDDGTGPRWLWSAPAPRRWWPRVDAW